MPSTTVDSNDLPYRFEVSTPPGDTFEKRWHFQYDLDDGNGPQDLPFTGCTLTQTVWKGTTAATPAVSVTNSDGGLVTQTIPAAIAAAFENGYLSKVVCVFPIGHAVFANGATKTLVFGVHNYKLEA